MRSLLPPSWAGDEKSGDPRDAAHLRRDESGIGDKTIADVGNKNHREARGNKKRAEFSR